VTRFVEATYPESERASAREANVTFELLVSELGRVTEATVVESAGAAFDASATEAVRAFEFAPAMQNGRAVAVRIRYRYRFRLRAVQPTQQAAEPVAVLSGTVRDPRNRPAAGVTVVLQLAEHAPLQATTAEDGSFRVALTETGAYDVSIETEASRPFHARERVYERDNITVTYRLAAPLVPAASGTSTTSTAPVVPTDPDEQIVTVRATRPPREVTRTTLERREITRIPGTGGDALRAIQNLPGLSRGAFLSGALIVRGSAPADTQVLVDGTVVPLLYHFGGLSSVIQTEMLDRIDFYPGNFSARFGRAMGGVVDVGLRSPRQRGIRAVANVSLIDASVFVEGAILPNLTFAIAGRRSYVDVVLNAVLSNIDSIGLTAAPVYYDYQGVLEWRPHPRHRVRLAMFGTDDTLSILFKRPGDNAPSFAGRVSFATRYHLAQLLWTHDFTASTQGRLMFSGGLTSVDLSVGDFVNFQLNFYPQNLRYEVSHGFGTTARLNVGIDWQWSPGNTKVDALRIEPGRPISSAQRISTEITGAQYLPAAYVEAELTPVRGLRLIPGARTDYFATTRRWILAPRFAGRWDITSAWAIKGGVGVFAQNPQQQEASRAPNNAFPGQTIGNPNLFFQRATHYSVGMEHVFSPFINVSVEGFVKVLDQLVVQTPTSMLLQQNPPPPYTNSGTGLVYGAEVLLRHRASDRFFGWLAYTLLHAERTDTPGGTPYAHSSDQTHILTVVGSFKLPLGFEVGARFRLVTGSPTTPVTGGIYDANGFSYAQVNGARASARNPYFHQLDVRVDKTFTFSWGNLGLFLEVINAYNAQNQEGVQYNYNYTESAPVTGLPIFPNLGLRVEWAR
jgi:TonB family protein